MVTGKSGVVARAQGAALFAGLDRASFVCAFCQKLRKAGLAVPLSAFEDLALGLQASEAFSEHAVSRKDLYWLMRVSLVKEREDLAVFDAVFEAVFDFELDRTGKRLPQHVQPSRKKVKSTGDVLHKVPVHRAGDPISAEGSAWATTPQVNNDEDDDSAGPTTAIPERLPARCVALADRSFDELSEEELLEMCRTLESSDWRWPERRSRRVKQSRRAGKVSMRLTVRSASRGSGEISTILYTRPRQRPRRIVMILDVSGSMESYVRAYLHTSRVMVRRGDMEVFAIGTGLHRLTPALRHRSVEDAMNLATQAVADRFGGTRLASNLGLLLRHKMWSRFVRGAVVVIASDGWDTDPPDLMETEMERLKRRAHSVIWLNPRSAAADFELKVASMAAAQPHCSLVLSGHSANAMLDVMNALAGQDPLIKCNRDERRMEKRERWS